jgi:hypothetical protein
MKIGTEIDPWCNGNTTDFGSVIYGSNPYGSTVYFESRYTSGFHRTRVVTTYTGFIHTRHQSIFFLLSCIFLIYQKRLYANSIIRIGNNTRKRGT